MAKIDKIKVGSTTYDIGGASGGYGEGTLTTAAWSGTAPNIVQTVTSGTGNWSALTTNDHPVLDVIIGSGADVDSANEAWSKIWKAETTANGAIKFYATETPTIAINVAAKW